MVSRLREEVRVGPGGTLYVDLDLGAIAVSVHARSTIEIDAEARGALAELFSFALDRQDGDVYLDGELLEAPRRWSGRDRVRVRAKVPAGCSVDLRTRFGPVRVLGVGGTVAAETVAGPVSVRDALGPALLRTSAGPIHVDGVERDVRAFTRGGPIRVRNASGSLELRTTAGPIRVRDARGRVDARTHAGPIAASFRADPAGSLRTLAGPIDVSLPVGAGADLDARTSAGGVRIDRAFRFTRAPCEDSSSRHRPFRGSLGPGGELLLLRSTLGPIRIHPRRPDARDTRPDPGTREPTTSASEPPPPGV